MVDIGPLTTMGAVLAYAVFEWGGVLRSDQYHYLLVLGLLAVALSLAAPSPPVGAAPQSRSALDPRSLARLHPDAGGSAARVVSRPLRSWLLCGQGHIVSARPSELKV